MNFNCISVSTLYIIFTILLIAIIIALIPIVKWYKWKINLKAERKARGTDDCYSNTFYSLFRWLEEADAAMFIIGICSAIAIAVYSCLPLGEIYSNRVHEPSRYSAVIAEAKTLTEALDVSEDIVNTDLYNRVVDYNTNLASIKSKFNNNDFRLNFSGKYDWNALERIDLNKGE